MEITSRNWSKHSQCQTKTPARWLKQCSTGLYAGLVPRHTCTTTKAETSAYSWGKKPYTTAYHPQSDGFIQRFNQTLQNMLSAYVNNSQADWDLHLQHATLAGLHYSSSVQENTGLISCSWPGGLATIDVMFLGALHRSNVLARSIYSKYLTK